MYVECEAKVVKTKHGCYNWAEIKPETGYVSGDTLIASVHGHPRNNFTYLGPSDIGTWAHHAKQAQYSETSGFGKPVTRKRKGNPRNYLFWGILRFFSRKWFSQWPSAVTFVTENLKQYRRDLVSIQENAHENSFKGVHETTENSSGLHMQEIGFFLNSFFKNSLLQAERWREE